ncbi:MAG: sugar-binding domain-containing protein [Verrucomicrobiota bacterium]|jgi:beta-galactosidase/beta-glucuronidase
MKNYRTLIVTMALSATLSQTASLDAAWAPVEGQLMTRWAKDVSADHALPEYPRPQMARKEWQNLNGLWDYAIAPKDGVRPADFDGQILVPFPVESALSGVKKFLSPTNSLWYRRAFTVPADWKGRHVLLNFGAVDWQAKIWVNGVNVGEHRGGYDPFGIDITGALNNNAGQEIVVGVWDPNGGAIPHGKQNLHPGGITYTAISGIWQTVWLEPVGKASIASLKITPDLDNGLVSVTVNGLATHFLDSAQVEVMDGARTIAKEEGKLGQAINLKIRSPKPWAPGSPFLYDLKVTLKSDGKAADEVASYFGMRKVEIKKDKAGLNRIFLNGKALFEMGPLDQGWWPDGLYTAPTDEALRFDIAETLRMGFNLARKHVKVEPDRWYYWADKLGLLVWQDMPSMDLPARNMPSRGRSGRGGGGGSQRLSNDDPYEIFEREYRAEIETHYNHPSIIMWVPFNEGWGEYDPVRIVSWTKQMDPTRLVNNASGWTDVGVGDVNDRHDYPGPGMNPLEEQRASVLGEFGGLGLPLTGHLWVERGAWGYQNMTNSADLTDHYQVLINALKGYEAHGLAAAVYTQLTDCETEVNGLMTYERNVNKIGTEQIAKINLPVYEVKSNTNAPIPVVPRPPRRP